MYITPLNTMIAHIENIETIIDWNEKLLQGRIMRYLNREEINEHCIVLIAVIADLIRDVENIMEYLTHIQKESMHPKLMPIDGIIAQLKEVTQQLSQGLYFSFKVHAEDWLAIERHTKIIAFCNKTNIYAITLSVNILRSQPTISLK